MAIWSNFDIDAVAVTADPETGKSWYQVVIHREIAGDMVQDAIDGATLGSWPRLQQWLGDRRVAVLAKGGLNPAARLLSYLEEQKPPVRQMLPWLGWHSGLGFATYEGIIRAHEVAPHEGAVPLVKKDSAPFRYGFVPESEARRVLREVLTFHDPKTCAVFGSWWAACFLKAQLVEHTALFPFVALEAPSESGKTSGFFGLMMQLNGNYQGQGEYTLAALRERIAAHRNGIVWIDDMAEVDAVLDLIRQATAEGSKAKMTEGWSKQHAVRLVAPIVLSGEHLGKLGHEKALLDRAVRLRTSSPIKRRSKRDSKRMQWDDIVALRHRYDNDLTKVAGTLAQMALRYEQHVSRLKELRVDSGRVADKWAILRFGARMLAAMTGQRKWVRLVDSWIDSQEDLGAENDLTLHVLPSLLRWEDWATGPVSREPGRAASCFIDEGLVWFNIPMAADQWKRIAQREWNPRTQSQTALEEQRKALDHELLTPSGRVFRRVMNLRRWDHGSHAVRLRYWCLPRDLSSKVIRRAEAVRKKS
jgi:hypothetical protein